MEPPCQIATHSSNKDMPLHFNKPGQNISLQISELAGQDESLFENAWMLMVININSQVFSITPVSNVNKFLAVLCFYHIRQFHCEPLNLESLCEVSIACSVSIL